MSALSIKEIAKLADVSIATVSRVINDNGRFSESTRKKVQEIIEKYGYQPNRVAKSLRIKKTKTVGIIVPDISNSFFSSTVQRIEEYLFERGYSTIICNAAHNRNKEAKYFKVLESEMVDGIIAISGGTDSLPAVLRNGLPLVYIDRSPSNNEAIFVGSDHYQGAVLATRHLMNLTSDITIILPSKQSISPMERLRGFKAAVTEHLDVTPEIFYFDGDDEKIRDLLLRKNETQKNFGIFANSDNLAAKILLQAHMLNIQVPRKMKLVGFDDSPISQICYPQLTTIQQNIQEIANLASNELIRLMNNQSVEEQDRYIRIPVKLIKRGTT